MACKMKIVHLALTLTLAVAVFCPTAYATFPGKNGRIAFVRGPDIYSINADGSDLRQLTSLGSDSSAFWESWSPDGKQIVFNEYTSPDFLGQLWLMEADGSNQRLLLADPDFDDERPSFTADGRSVVFSRCRLDIEACALFEVEISGGHIRALNNFELGIQDFSPHYSSDDRLAFKSVGRKGIICAIELVGEGREGLQSLTPANLSPQQPDWSPDGTQIAFSTHCDNPQNEEIWVVKIYGDGLQRLTSNGDDYLSGPHDYHPSWSPQGDVIVFERDAPDFSDSGIFIIKTDGTQLTRVFSLKQAARVDKWRAPRSQKLDARALRHLRQIEDGGAMPQWGPAN
jgi:Tol biopolymer transport system component